MRRLIVPLAAAAVTAAAVAATSFGADGGGESQQSAQPVPPAEPINVLSRAAIPQDAIKPIVADGIESVAGAAPTVVRKAISADGKSVFVARAADRYCVVLNDDATGAGSVACNSLDSVAKGYLFTRFNNTVAGVAPNDVTAVALDGKSTSVQDNAYVASSGRFDTLVMQSPKGATTFTLPGSATAPGPPQNGA